VRTPNFALIDERDLADVREIVETIVDAIGNEQLPSLMLVGARCRDLLHYALGYKDLIRATQDVDIAISVAGWSVHEQLAQRFERVGSNGVCFKIAEVPVDVVPFGEVESPPGTVSRPAAGEGLDVWGFDVAFDKSIEIVRVEETSVRLPTPLGYSLLKLRAWIDRSSRGQPKDGPDVGVIMRWATDDQIPLDTEEQIDWYESYEGDLELVAVHAWGRAIAREYGDDSAGELAEGLRSSSLEDLALLIARSRISAHQSGAQRVRDRVDESLAALLGGLEPPSRAI